MRRIEHIAVIAHDMGRIFEFLGIASLLPFVVLAVFSEWDQILPMATAPAAFLLLGYAISHLPHRDIEPSFSVTMTAVALAWLAIAFVGALPFFFGLSLPYPDAVFEAMSGWTGTGFTMLLSPDTAPKTLLFWRSLSHWVGGIGIIAFGLSLHRQTRLSLFRLYRAEGREEELVSATASTGRRLWMIYLVLTLAFTGLIMTAGIPLWDSLNLVMVAISTGGFTLHAGGLAYYNSVLLETLLIPVMLCGAVPFKIFFFLYNGKVRAMLKDRIVRVLLAIALTGSLATSLDLYMFGSGSLSESFRQGTFMAVSGLCTCGLANADPHAWAVIPLAVVILLMFIGGAMGSTAGGVKVNRVVMVYEGIKFWFRRFFVSSRVMVQFRYGGKTVKKELSEVAITRNLLVIVLYVLAIFIATVFTLHLYITSFQLEEVLFELVSALSNAGLTVGLIGPASPIPVKWLFILLMWLGRLEIVPVVIIAMGAVRVLRDDLAEPVPPEHG